MLDSLSRHRCAAIAGALAAALVLAVSAAAQEDDGDGYFNGDAMMPGDDGGLVIGGPLDGSILPGADGGQVLGGPLGGSALPGRDGGMVLGGPRDGSRMPNRDGSDYRDRGRFEEIAPEGEADGWGGEYGGDGGE